LEHFTVAVAAEQMPAVAASVEQVAAAITDQDKTFKVLLIMA
jgi:hypothetical protein